MKKQPDIGPIEEAMKEAHDFADKAIKKAKADLRNFSVVYIIGIALVILVFALVAF